MKKILVIFTVLFFALSGWSVYGHGEGTDVGGSGGMMDMMDLMHEHMDENRVVDCDKVSDMEMMEKGEEMMEEMMGHDDHERMETSLNDEDHDSMHMMMGMWSSGCIGDEAMNTLMERYGFSQRVNEPERGAANWPSVIVGLVLGAIGGWVGSQLLRKKTVVS